MENASLDEVPTVSFRIESKVSIIEKISFKLHVSVHFAKNEETIL